MPSEALIFDAVRTPRGRGKSDGSLHGVRPISLVVGLIEALRERNPSLDPARIDDIVLGVVSPIGEQGGDIAKAASLVAGLPETVSGLQVDRFCASGLEAVNLAAQKIASGWEHLVLAGGVESMSRVPIGSDGGALMSDPTTVYDTHYVHQGVAADLIATIEGFSREDVDRFALRSQQLAAAAEAEGRFTKSMVTVRDQNGLPVLDHDEHIRPTTLEGLGKLRPSFAAMGKSTGFDEVALQKFHWLSGIDHVHTPGNSSGMVDGASLLIIGSETVGRDLGLTPRARIVATALSGADPMLTLTGPMPATEKLLGIAGLSVDDIDLFELNEAFSCVVLKYQRDLKIPDEKLNVNGGAIAMGHPLGATGGMLVGTVLDELERRDEQRAVVTLCVGGGMGIATLIERV